MHVPCGGPNSVLPSSTWRPAGAGGRWVRRFLVRARAGLLLELTRGCAFPLEGAVLTRCQRSALSQTSTSRACLGLRVLFGDGGQLETCGTGAARGLCWPHGSHGGESDCGAPKSGSSSTWPFPGAGQRQEGRKALCPLSFATSPVACGLSTVWGNLTVSSSSCERNTHEDIDWFCFVYKEKYCIFKYKMLGKAHPTMFCCPQLMLRTGKRNRFRNCCAGFLDDTWAAWRRGTPAAVLGLLTCALSLRVSHAGAHGHAHVE